MIYPFVHDDSETLRGDESVGSRVWPWDVGRVGRRVGSVRGLGGLCASPMAQEVMPGEVRGNRPRLAGLLLLML